MRAPGPSFTRHPDWCIRWSVIIPRASSCLAGCKGATEFYDENGKFVETLDVWWFINHYESYCREQGIPINKQLYL